MPKVSTLTMTSQYFRTLVALFDVSKAIPYLFFIFHIKLPQYVDVHAEWKMYTLFQREE